MTTLIVSLLLVVAQQQESPGSLLERLRSGCAERPLVVAHRGASADFPENTLPAIGSALGVRADVVEFDFYESSDGVLFLHHDDTLDRTTNAVQVFDRKGLRPKDLSWAQLRQLDAGAWKGHSGVQPCTVEQALERILPHAVPMIEHKDGSATTLVELLRRRGWTRRVLVQSFNAAWLEEVRALEPSLLLATLGPTRDREVPDTEAAFDWCHEHHISIVHWSGRDLKQSQVLRLKERGLLVVAYTINDDLGVLGARELGLDMVTTDVPGHARNLLLKQRERRRQ